MTSIPDAIVEQSRKTIGSLDESSLRSVQRTCFEDQRELAGFLVGYNGELPEEVIALGLHIGLVVMNAFRLVYGATLRMVTEEDILRRLTLTQQALVALPASQEAVATLTSPDGTDEPAILRYIVEALGDAEDDEPTVDLSDTERWQLIAALKTVAEALHEASAALPAPGAAATDPSRQVRRDS